MKNLKLIFAIGMFGGLFAPVFTKYVPPFSYNYYFSVDVLLYLVIGLILQKVIFKKDKRLSKSEAAYYWTFFIIGVAIGYIPV